MQQDNEGYGMKTIQMEDILRIYNAYGLNGKDSDSVRFSINTGRMGCPLNTGKEHYPNNPGVSNITRQSQPLAMTDSLK